MPFMVSVEVRKNGSIGEFSNITFGSTTDDPKVVTGKIEQISQAHNYETRGYRVLRVR